MLSEKLDKVMTAESTAAEKIAGAEMRASEIINEARTEAERIRLEKISSAKKKAQAMIGETETECNNIIAKYDLDGTAEAEKLSKIAAKNEMFGMSAVIMKIVP
ncbi:MAG: hypothetical protein IKU19_08305 [Clostridia bacterium]|nr:hypothetical protein [Clostridia bacterium]